MTRGADTTKEIEATLIALKEDYERLEALVPWEEVEKRLIPEPVREQVGKILGEIRRHTYDVDRLLGPVSTLRGEAMHALRPELLKFYREVVKPRRPRMALAHDYLLDPGDPDWMFWNIIWPIYPMSPDETTSSTLVKDAFEFAFNYTQVMAGDEDAYEPLEDRCPYFEEAWELVDLPWFQPDRWISNADTLSSVLVAGELDRIPEAIRCRLREVYMCIVLDQWLAAAALARSILEGTLLHVAPRLGVDTRSPEYPDGTKDLYRLIEDVARHLPALRDGMHQIRQHGNQILHPDPGKMPELPSVRKKVIDMVQKLRAVVEGLYETR